MNDLTIRTVEKHVHVNGVKITYYESGDPNGKPLILVHAFPFSKDLWKGQLTVSEHHRVIAYDVRGFGGSTTNRDAASIDLFGSDLLGLMDALGIKKSIVGGISMGGYITLNAFTRYPERFMALVLCDTQCIADSDENRENRYKTMKEIEVSGLRNFAEKFTGSLFSEKTIENNSDLVTKTKNLVAASDPENVRAVMNALAQRRETCTQVRNNETPVLIIVGKEDKITPVSQAELLYNAFRNATLHEIPNAGHLPNLEQPETFNRYLGDFLEAF